MRLLNWYLMRFCVDLLIGYWRTRKRALASVADNGASVPPVIASYSYSSPQYDPEDAARVEFLQCKAGTQFPLTTWETQFIDSNLGRIWFTQKQKAVIDKLRTKYQFRLWGWRSPARTWPEFTATWACGSWRPTMGDWPRNPNEKRPRQSASQKNDLSARP
jgi:hypothetical protein